MKFICDLHARELALSPAKCQSVWYEKRQAGEKYLINNQPYEAVKALGYAYDAAIILFQNGW